MFTQSAFPKENLLFFSNGYLNKNCGSVTSVKIPSEVVKSLKHSDCETLVNLESKFIIGDCKSHSNISAELKLAAVRVLFQLCCFWI